MRQYLSLHFVVLFIVFLFENGTPGHAQILCKKDCDGLCNRTAVDAGHGYSRYPKDCTKFVQCWKVGNIITPQLRTCPFGQFWDPDAVSCKLSYLARCATDPCKNTIAGTAYGAKEYGCRAYWQCNDNISFHRCCPIGSAFVDGAGCVNDAMCTDSCPPGEKMAVCDKKRHWDKRYYIEILPPGIGEVIRPCPPGTIFVKEKCLCDFETSR